MLNEKATEITYFNMFLLSMLSTLAYSHKTFLVPHFSVENSSINFFFLLNMHEEWQCFLLTIMFSRHCWWRCNIDSLSISLIWGGERRKHVFNTNILAFTQRNDSEVLSFLLLSQFCPSSFLSQKCHYFCSQIPLFSWSCLDWISVLEFLYGFSLVFAHWFLFFLSRSEIDSNSNPQ